MTNVFVVVGIILIGGLGLGALFVHTSSSSRYVNHPTANIQRVDLPEDGLEVWHDGLRGVTCYSGTSLACLPDGWLKPDASR
jgi:hypothetical protein